MVNVIYSVMRNQRNVNWHSEENKLSLTGKNDASYEDSKYKCNSHLKKSTEAETTQEIYRKIQHSITAQDHQPMPDSCIISMAVGQLKVDEDPIMGFHQMFLLKNINDAWVCTNDMFRLALHNFG
ncbi:hypothetical protein GH733_010835 [Mirounga leonina]|nr:hypothetical protein GH733_010835 [Mirounga leonina]